jgi:hypothetical protein
MANRALFLNTKLASSDPDALHTGLTTAGNDYVEVAEAAYRIPVPWLCCFRQENLKPIKVRLSARSLDLQLPFCTRIAAIQNLERALPIFEHITGEQALARKFWHHAYRRVQEFPLPYVTIDPIEVMLMTDPEGDMRRLSAALSGTAEAITHLKYLSGYEDGILPYAPDILYAVSGPKPLEARTTNTLALDIGLGCQWHLSEGTTQGKIDVMGKYADDEPNLVSLVERVESEMRSRAPSARLYISFTPSEGATGILSLKGLIAPDTDAELTLLQGDSSLAGFLELPALISVCRNHGFEFAGYVIRSNESVRRRFTGDWSIYNDWLKEPPVIRP